MIETIKLFLISRCGELAGFAAGALMASARMLCDETKPAWQRIALEALICGLIGVAIGSALEAFGFRLYLFAGCAAGVLGSESLRFFAKRSLCKLTHHETKKD